MSGPVRNPDKINTIGIVVVGICGAVLVYVSIVALQAFYMNDTSDIQMMADYGGNDVTARSIRTSQIGNITEYGANTAAPGKPATYRVPIDVAMKKVVDAAKLDPALLVPTQGRADKATVKPIFGRPQPMAPAPGTEGTAVPDGATGPDDATTDPGTAPMTPTAGQGPGGGPVVPASGDPQTAPTPAGQGSAAKGDAPQN